MVPMGGFKALDRVSGPPVKSQMAIGFLRNSGMDTPREAIGPNCFSRESVQPSVIYTTF